MNVSYFYCHHCGFESFNLFVAYSRQTADSEHCFCPECKKESSDFEQDE
jgi:hypothetical protein